MSLGLAASPAYPIWPRVSAISTALVIFFLNINSPSQEAMISITLTDPGFIINVFVGLDSVGQGLPPGALLSKWHESSTSGKARAQNH
jgi:hypothetical protein